jgi:hypothetical protein
VQIAHAAMAIWCSCCYCHHHYKSAPLNTAINIHRLLVRYAAAAATQAGVQGHVVLSCAPLGLTAPECPALCTEPSCDPAVLRGGMGSASVFLRACSLTSVLRSDTCSSRSDRRSEMPLTCCVVLCHDETAAADARRLDV